MAHSEQNHVEIALARGLAFLLARQSASGFWLDWQLPPGESLVWTTAYVAYRLSSLRGACRDSARAAMQKAAVWLLEREFSGGGWGYAEEVGSDADTTALAIFFLASQGIRVAERTYERLKEFQCADGGFATFTPESSFGAWVMSHPDVTPIALMALMTRNQRPDASIERGVNYTRQQMTPAGLWNSFWWISSLYATEANLRFLRRAGLEKDTCLTRGALRSLHPKNVFEQALLILSLLHTGAAAREPELNQAMLALLSAQLEDGSWPSAPILRLTDRDCSEPWINDNAGQLFADQNRVFTSATVVSALSAL